LSSRWENFRDSPREYRAEKAGDRLHDLLPRRATVIRDAQRQSIDAVQLVPDDVVVRSAGDACRSSTVSPGSLGWFSNRYLALAVRGEGAMVAGSHETLHALTTQERDTRLAPLFTVA